MGLPLLYCRLQPYRETSAFIYDINRELIYCCIISQTLFEIIGKRNRSKKTTITLIVIIDDLDRCSKETIVQMLEAMHLLLEQPTAPMAVLLAVDPELILSAISKHLGEGNEDHEGDKSKAKCLQYLDKIVHIPFCVPPTAEKERLVFLDSLLKAHDNSCPKMLERLKKLKVSIAVITPLDRNIRDIENFSLSPRGR